jgi:hypothetical protein
LLVTGVGVGVPVCGLGERDVAGSAVTDGETEGSIDDVATVALCWALAVTPAAPRTDGVHAMTVVRTKTDVAPTRMRCMPKTR